MKIGRETTDLDFLLTRIKAEETNIKDAFEEIIQVPSADGFKFSFDAIELLKQPHMRYPGYRILLRVAFEKMKDKIQVDVGVGDVVKPLNQKIPLVKYRGQPFFENEISLLIYPIEAIFAEKLETIISKGAGNSRMKDYHDIILMMRNERKLNLENLRKSIKNTFSNRGTLFRPIEFDQPSLIAIQRLWTAHLNGLGDITDELDLPKDIAAVISEINQYIQRIREFDAIEVITT